jgi:predicted amidophosphoribosyltransferase
MQKFRIDPNNYLSQTITGYYNTRYRRMGNPGNPDYLNHLKNTFNDYPELKLKRAKDELKNVLKSDLPYILREKRFNQLTICTVPRAKAENKYSQEQQQFRSAVKEIALESPNLIDGTDYILRRVNTMTTHLAGRVRNNDGDRPYPGITEETCRISKNIEGKNILLIDDIYTPDVNIDEDAIQALLNGSPKSIYFYAVARVIR